MSEIISHDHKHKTIAKSEDGVFYVHTTFNDDAALEQNERIRRSGMLDNGKLGLHDDEDIRFVISVPSNLQWEMFKRKHLETYKLIVSRIEAERMKGCKQLQILEPAWVVMERL